jgi:DNA-binding response OmpR family regulator
LPDLLEGLRILVLEDEFLIAMDVEQLCRDNGAIEVEIRTTMEDLDEGQLAGFDAAIIDVMLGGVSTLDFARRLAERGVPFIFSTGYADNRDIARLFPDVGVVGKPYSGEALIAAVVTARRRSQAGG